MDKVDKAIERLKLGSDMPYFKAASVGVYNDDEESWLFRGVEVKVSHWMPLPDAPKGVNDGSREFWMQEVE
jgi:hypothetical protein